MGKTKHPDEVKPKQFSDSLELFDSLFQEELQSGTQKEVPAPSPKAKPPSTYKGGPDQQLEDFPSAKPKKPPDDETKPLLRKPKLPPQAKRSAPPVGAPNPKRSHRAKGDTLEMRRKGTKPTSGPVQTDKKPVLETEVVPQGIIVKGIDQIKEPPPDDVKPETVGKFYTPKESKGIIPTVTIKESNLYKVVLSGFALAIIVMVVINFLGIMGSDETKDVSPTKKAAVQKTPSNKRPPKVANKPKNNKAVETSKKNAQKNSTAWKSSKPVSKPQANKPVKKSKIRPQSVPVKPSVPDSVSPPVTTQPTVAQEKSKDLEQMVTSESFKKHLATILDQQKPGSPESSREPTTTIQETAKAAPVVSKGSEPAVMNQQEIKSSPTSPPS